MKHMGEFDNGTLKFHGPHGNAVQSTENAKEYEALLDFMKGKGNPHQVAWIVLSSTPYYEGKFSFKKGNQVNILPEGNVTMWHPNGDKYVGDFVKVKGSVFCPKKYSEGNLEEYNRRITLKYRKYCTYRNFSPHCPCCGSPYSFKVKAGTCKMWNCHGPSPCRETTGCKGYNSYGKCSQCNKRWVSRRRLQELTGYHGISRLIREE